MMKDFPICGLQRDALNPVCAHGYARVCASQGFFQASSGLSKEHKFGRGDREREESSLNLRFLKVSF